MAPWRFASCSVNYLWWRGYRLDHPSEGAVKWLGPDEIRPEYDSPEEMMTKNGYRFDPESDAWRMG